MLLGSLALLTFQSQELSDQPSPKYRLQSALHFEDFCSVYLLHQMRESILRAGTRGSCPWLWGRPSLLFSPPQMISVTSITLRTADPDNS